MKRGRGGGDSEVFDVTSSYHPSSTLSNYTLVFMAIMMMMITMVVIMMITMMVMLMITMVVMLNAPGKSVSLGEDGGSGGSAMQKVIKG